MTQQMVESSSTGNLDELRQWLADDALIAADTAELIPLTGGVSSDVVLIRTPQRVFVAKRALSKLRVKDDWYAATDRNRYEHQYITAAGEIVPESFPEILYTNDHRGFFCMTWLGDGWENWKTLLLRGVANVGTVETAARIIGRIHQATIGRGDLKDRFDTLKNFHELRIEPYLLTTAQRHPELASHFQREAKRLAAIGECLVHGDYSPKNLLVRDEQVVVLDCEVAWYGAASFDLAFLLNHLALKVVYHYPKHEPFRSLFPAAMESYFAARSLTPAQQEQLQCETLRLVLMLLLARIDGKSPVEYLEKFPERKECVRRFVHQYLPTWHDSDPYHLVNAMLQSMPATNA